MRAGQAAVQWVFSPWRAAALAAVADGGHGGRRPYRMEAVVDAGRVRWRPLLAVALAGNSPGGRRLFCGHTRGVRRLRQTTATVAGGHDGRYSNK